MIIATRLPLALMALMVCASADGATIRRVVGPGDPVPGVPHATFVGAFGTPDFDYLGNVRIKATIEGADLTWRNNSGFWMESDGQLQLVLRHGDLLPGAMGDERIQGSYAYGNAMDWAKVDLTGSGLDARNSQALIAMDKGQVRVVARTGQAAPGQPAGTVFHYVGYPTGDLSTGRLLFDVQLTGPGINLENDETLWMDDGNGLRLIAREGDTAHGGPTPFRGFHYGKADRNGRAMFEAAVDSRDPLIRHQTGIYAERDGRIVELMHVGMQAPGLSDGVQIRSAYPHIRSDGAILFDAYLGESQPGFQNDTAIYIERENGLELVLREGDPIPNVPSTSHSWLSAGGTSEDALATLTVNGGDQWELTETGWREVKWPKLGDPAPGTSERFGRISHRQRNAHGRRVLDASLIGENDFQEIGEGIWADDENGQLQLVLRYGERNATEPGIYPPSDDWEIVDLNDRGEILLVPHRFAYNEVYLATANAIPEPATLVLTLIGAAGVVFLALVSRRRHCQRP